VGLACLILAFLLKGRCPQSFLSLLSQSKQRPAILESKGPGGLRVVWTGNGGYHSRAIPMGPHLADHRIKGHRSLPSCNAIIWFQAARGVAVCFGLAMNPGACPQKNHCPVLLGGLAMDSTRWRAPPAIRVAFPGGRARHFFQKGQRLQGASLSERQVCLRSHSKH